MNEKKITPDEKQADPAASASEQPRRLGLKIRSRVRAGAVASETVLGEETDGIMPKSYTPFCTIFC